MRVIENLYISEQWAKQQGSRIDRREKERKKADDAEDKLFRKLKPKYQKELKNLLFLRMAVAKLDESDLYEEAFFDGARLMLELMKQK